MSIWLVIFLCNARSEPLAHHCRCRSLASCRCEDQWVSAINHIRGKLIWRAQFPFEIAYTNGAPSAHSNEQLLSLQYLLESSVFLHGRRLLLTVCVCRYLLCVFLCCRHLYLCVWWWWWWWWCVCVCVCECVCIPQTFMVVVDVANTCTTSDSSVTIKSNPPSYFISCSIRYCPEWLGTIAVVIFGEINGQLGNNNKQTFW